MITQARSLFSFGSFVVFVVQLHPVDIWPDKYEQINRIFYNTTSLIEHIAPNSTTKQKAFMRATEQTTAKRNKRCCCWAAINLLCGTVTFKQLSHSLIRSVAEKIARHNRRNFGDTIRFHDKMACAMRPRDYKRYQQRVWTNSILRFFDCTKLFVCICICGIITNIAVKFQSENAQITYLHALFTQTI